MCRQLAGGVLLVVGAVLQSAQVQAADPWVVYEGYDGPGKGKHIVLISGDEEYRSEEALPQLAKILARHHGFKCTVLFAIDPKDGTINPNKNDNIPGLEALRTADLAVFFLRFRNLPDNQMKEIVDYVESGRPIMGLRTATHSFNLSGKSARVFTTTIGASQDLLAEGTRRMLVNACYWCMGMEDKISSRSVVNFVGEFKPLPFKFGGYKKGVKPSDLVSK